MLLLLAVGGLLFSLDQWSKRLVQFHARGRCISWGPGLRIRRVTNLKRAYARRSTRVVLVLVWFVALLSAAALHQSGAWFQSHAALSGLGLALGGAAGNLLDILRLRYVVDFIDLRGWTVFNLADVAIVAGLVAAFWPEV